MAVVPLGLALSHYLSSNNSESWSYRVALHWLGFSIVAFATSMQGLIYVVSYFKKENLTLWKTHAEQGSRLQPMDMAVLFVLLLLTISATAEIVVSLVYMGIYIAGCELKTGMNGIIVAAFFYNGALLAFFWVAWFLFYTKSRFDVSDAKDSTRKVTVIFVFCIFAALFSGLHKFLDFVEKKGLPLNGIAKSNCSNSTKVDQHYSEIEMRLRPSFIQLCVVLLFFLLAKIANRGSSKSGVLHFWSAPLQNLNQLGEENFTINYDTLRPYVKTFIFILVVALAFTLGWSGASISAERVGNTNLYAAVNFAEYVFSSFLCICGFFILRRFTEMEPKQSFDTFIAAGLIFTSCFPVVYSVLAGYANYACLHNSSCTSAVDNATNLPLQIAFFSANLTEVALQVVFAVTTRKLAKDLWSLQVQIPSEQGIYMMAVTSRFSLYIYPFIVAYMTFTNFARYFVDIAIERPISIGKTANAFQASGYIYGRSRWEFIDNVLLPGGLFRLLCFFVFLQGTFNVMLSTFTEYWRSKTTTDELGHQPENVRRGETSPLIGQEHNPF